MTREQLRQRIAALEEYRRRRQPPSETFCIFFVDNNGNRDHCNVASGPGGFICRREPDEEIEVFQVRAQMEVLATKPKVPVAGLIFSKVEANNTSIMCPLLGNQ